MCCTRQEKPILPARVVMSIPGPPRYLPRTSAQCYWTARAEWGHAAFDADLIDGSSLAQCSGAGTWTPWRGYQSTIRSARDGSSARPEFLWRSVHLEARLPSAHTVLPSHSVIAGAALFAPRYQRILSNRTPVAASQRGRVLAKRHLASDPKLATVICKSPQHAVQQHISTLRTAHCHASSVTCSTRLAGGSGTLAGPRCCASLPRWARIHSLACRVVLLRRPR